MVKALHDLPQKPMNVLRPTACLAWLMLVFSNCLYSAALPYPANYTPAELLSKLLNGEYIASQKAVKWLASPADIHEYNGQLTSEDVLYSFVDSTIMITRENERVYYTIFRTAPMLAIDGEWTNPNNCHACGVNLGYFSYIIENDSIYVNKFKRNFAVHGSFGERSYILSMINLGDGFELLKVDDMYAGMGIRSVITSFYQDGTLKLDLVSQEDNRGNKENTRKGYYEFKTDFTYDEKLHTISLKRSGYRIYGLLGIRIRSNKKKNLIFNNYTLQF